MFVGGREVVTGPDISNHQRDVDHRAVAAAGHSFLWAKATEGVGYVDPYYVKNREGALAAGLVFGAYHWIKPNQDVDAQVANFIRATSAAAGCSFVVLDAEERGLTAEQISRWLIAVEQKVSCPIAIYCGAYTDPKVRPSSWRKYAPWLAAYPAGYNPDPDPTQLRAPVPPTPWGSWTGWQYTSSATCPGISGRCDMNVLDKAWFDRLTGAPDRPTSVTPEAPTQKDIYMAQHALFQTGPDLKLMAEVGIVLGVVGVRTQTEPNSNFTPWFSLHSDEDPQPFPAVEVTGGTNADGRQEIVAYGKDGQCARKVRNLDGTWRPWAVEA